MAAGRELGRYSHIHVFQSLFCWIGDGGPAPAWRNCWPGACFNPCSVGLGMAAVPSAPCVQHISLFQSLFCWIGDGGARPVELPITGVLVSILVLLDWRWRPARWGRNKKKGKSFNPCSVGLEMAAGGMRGGNPRIGMVSILVLLDWRWRHPCATSRTMSYCGFNPCSVGLEMAASGHQITKATCRSFNPCSVGLEMAAWPSGA